METLEQTRLRLENFTKDSFPDADTSPGSVLSELLVKVAATLHNPIKNDFDSINQASSVSAAINSTSDTTSSIIDSIASNYNVSRNQGRKVAGKIKVTVTSKKNYFVDNNFEVIQSNLQIKYKVTGEFSITTKSASASLLDNEIPLLQEGALFYFIIPVEAEEVGAIAQVSNKTKFILGATTKLNEFVQAEAYGNFTSGQPVEVDKELITRFKQGLSVKNLISVNSISAVLKEQFPTLKAISIIGSNDVELQRSKNNIFGITVPGLSDVYVRTSESLETFQFTKTGSLITSGSNIGKWTITINPTDAPGFYRILSILPAQTNLIGTQVFDSVTYTTVLGSGRVNDIDTPSESRFTKYQQCEVVFDYEGTAATQNFLVTVIYQPFIKDIQDIFLSDNDRVTCADYLVKAVIPCNVSVFLKLTKKFPLDDVPVDQIKKDIFTYVNNIPFGEDLNVSKIIDICHNYDIKTVALPVVVKGSIIVPNPDKDESINIESNDKLVIPDAPDKGVSKLTTAFFINYFNDNGDENIGIQVL